MPNQPQPPSIGERIEAALGAFDTIAASPLYSADMIVGAYATVAALTQEGVASGELDLGSRIEAELQAAERAGKIAVDQNDMFTASTMQAHVEHCETIIDLMTTPEEQRPAKPAAMDKAKTGKGKGQQ